jgi:hypothetical protein
VLIDLLLGDDKSLFVLLILLDEIAKQAFDLLTHTLERTTS